MWSASDESINLDLTTIDLSSQRKALSIRVGGRHFFAL